LLKHTNKKLQKRDIIHRDKMFHMLFAIY